MNIEPMTDPAERLAAQLTIACIDGDMTAALALLRDHGDAADAAWTLAAWLAELCDATGTSRQHLRGDLIAGLRRGALVITKTTAGTESAAAPEE